MSRGLSQRSTEGRGERLWINSPWSLSLSSFHTLVDLGPDLISCPPHSLITTDIQSHHLSSFVFSGPGLWQVLETPVGCELLAVMERRRFLKGVSTLGQGAERAEHFTNTSCCYCYSHYGSIDDWPGFANVFPSTPPAYQMEGLLNSTLPYFIVLESI